MWRLWMNRWSDPFMNPRFTLPAGTCRAIESASFQRPIYYYSEV